jgi:hypothetical protein
MATSQEKLYAASRIVAMVADCLLDYTSCGGEISTYDLLELVGRLDIVVDAIRQVNGACD